MIAILGRPTESNCVMILGISGTASRWNGQVALKSFERLGGAETPK